MKNYNKPILIIFSIALNIGFVVASIIIYYFHPSSSHYGYLTYANKFINDLELSVDQNRKIKTCLDLFKKETSDIGAELQDLENKTLILLSSPKKLNEDKLNEIYVRQDLLFQKKHQIVRDHLLVMKKELGDEKSAQFFSQLIEKK